MSFVPDDPGQRVAMFLIICFVVLLTLLVVVVILGLCKKAHQERSTAIVEDIETATTATPSPLPPTSPSRSSRVFRKISSVYRAYKTLEEYLSSVVTSAEREKTTEQLTNEIHQLTGEISDIIFSRQSASRVISSNNFLGQGAFGVVLEGFLLKSDGVKVSVALKTFTEPKRNRLEVQEAAEVQHLAERLKVLRECRNLKDVQGHPNVVSLLGVTMSQTGWPSLVMERMDLSLDKYLRGFEVPPPRAWILRVCRSVTAAVVHIHRLKKVHRDIASRNVFIRILGRTEEIKLGDLGLGREVLGGYSHQFISQWCLPLCQLAPECFESPDPKYHQRSDVWQLALFIAELYNQGYCPISPRSTEADMRMLFRNEWVCARGCVVPTTIWDNIPTELQVILQQMLTKDTANRIVSSAVAQKLQDLV